MTQQDLYTLIDEIVKVNPAATDTTKLQGSQHRKLLKFIIDFIVANGGGATSLDYDWSKPSERFNGYYSNDQDFLTGFYKFMHPNQPPNGSLTAVNAVRQRGSSNSVTLNYVVQPGSGAITSIKINGVSVPISPLSGTFSTTTPANTDQTFTMLVTDANGLTKSVQAFVHYRSKQFIFPYAFDLAGYSDAQLSDILNSSSGPLVDTRFQSVKLDPDNEILYVAYETSLGAGAIFTNNIQDTSFNARSFSYTNTDGYVEEYFLYQGDNYLTGNYKVEVK